MKDTKYCMCCGEMVPYNYLERYGRRELTCVYCGFVIDVLKSGRQLLIDQMPAVGYLENERDNVNLLI